MSPATLLLIDDHPLVLQLRKQSLEALGYSIVTAADAASVIAVLASRAIAAVLVEYKLEGIDAEAVADHIKRRFPSQPIVLLSACSDLPGRILWLVDEYVMRSDPVEKLSEIIERLTCPEKLNRPRRPAIGCEEALPPNRSVA